MTDSWAPPPSRAERLNRTLNGRLRGTVDGRMRGTEPVPKPGVDSDIVPDPGEIFASFTEVLQTFVNNEHYQQLINEFFYSLGETINHSYFNSVVLQFVDNILQEMNEYFNTYNVTNEVTLDSFASRIIKIITDWLEAHPNSITTEDLAERVIRIVTKWLEDHPNSPVTEDLGGAVLQAINIFITNNPESPAAITFGDILGDIINNSNTNIYGVVYVQPEQPTTTKIGTLWFDTDAF